MSWRDAIEKYFTHKFCIWPRKWNGYIIHLQHRNDWKFRYPKINGATFLSNIRNLSFSMFNNTTMYVRIRHLNNDKLTKYKTLNLPLATWPKNLFSKSVYTWKKRKKCMENKAVEVLFMQKAIFHNWIWFWFAFYRVSMITVLTAAQLE